MSRQAYFPGPSGTLAWTLEHQARLTTLHIVLDWVATGGSNSGDAGAWAKVQGGEGGSYLHQLGHSAAPVAQSVTC